MMDSPDLVADIVTDVDEVFLFSPGQSMYESFVDADEPPVVVAPENEVDAETFVELPLNFQDVRDRIRFGIE
ncbi:MAG: diadenylate cyclase domain-containing protein, partial [Halobaculum sp.]